MRVSLGIQTKLFFIFLFTSFLLSIFSALAQTGGSIPRSATATSSGALVTSSDPTGAGTAPQATSTPPPPSALPPRGGVPALSTTTSAATSAPVIAPIAAPLPPLEEAQNNVPNPNAGSSLLILLSAFAGMLGGFVAYALKIKKSRSNKKQGEEKEGSRCFDIKKLMEEKLKELTDIRGQLEGKTKEKAREIARETVKGTAAGELLAAAERAEKEYNRLKMLYDKCMIEIQKTKRVFIVHGWDGYPEEGWFPWLKKELEKNGFKVFVPQLPDAGSPRIQKWVPALAHAVGAPDEQTYFVGHSMGCQTIARYLETLPEDQKVGGAVFVAGFFKRLNLEDDPSVQETDKLWLGTPIDLRKIKTHLPKSVAIFSDDDPWVPLDNQDDFRDKLSSEIIVEHARGHFSGTRDNTLELPIVLEKLLSL